MSPRTPREFFSRHADDYARSASHAKGDDLARLLERLEPRATERALDVATGTGFTAVALSPLVSSVLGVDITVEMLAEAARLASQKGVTNLSLAEAAAESLPHPSVSFDIVTSRRAPHHFRDVGAFVKEAARVLRIGGRLGVADMSPVEGTQEQMNSLERIRDGTHARALTLRQWIQEFRDAGLEVVSAELLPAYVPFERWLYPVSAGGLEESEIRDRLNELPDRVKVLMGTQSEGGRVVGFVKVRAVVVGKKTPG